MLYQRDNYNHNIEKTILYQRHKKHHKTTNKKNCIFTYLCGIELCSKRYEENSQTTTAKNELLKFFKPAIGGTFLAMGGSVLNFV